MNFIGGEDSAKRAFVDDTMATVRNELATNQAVQDRLDPEALEFLMGVTETYYVPDKRGMLVEPTREQLDSGGIPVVALEADERFRFSDEFSFLDEASKQRAVDYLENIGCIGPVKSTVEDAQWHMKFWTSRGDFDQSLAELDVLAMLTRPLTLLNGIEVPGNQKYYLNGRSMMVLQYPSTDDKHVADAVAVHEIWHIKQARVPLLPLWGNKLMNQHESINLEDPAYLVENGYLYGKMANGFEPLHTDKWSLAVGYAINQLHQEGTDLDNNPWDVVVSNAQAVWVESRAAKDPREFWMEREAQVLGSEQL